MAKYTNLREEELKERVGEDFFADIGSKINSLSATYATAEGQLLSGRFNFARQLEGWKDKGLITNSQIDPRLLEEEG